jgi:hypothetical protein
MLENTKEFISEVCPNCGGEINIKAYRQQYVKDLIAYSKKAHNALRQIIKENKVSPPTKIYDPNGQYDTIGNIIAEAPHKFKITSPNNGYEAR